MKRGKKDYIAKYTKNQKHKNQQKVTNIISIYRRYDIIY